MDVIPQNHPYPLPFNDLPPDLVVSSVVLEHNRDDLNLLKEFIIFKDEGLLFSPRQPYCLSLTRQFTHLYWNYYQDQLYLIGDLKKLISFRNFIDKNITPGLLFLKNSAPYSFIFGKIDRFFNQLSPYKYFATNLDFSSRAA